MTSKSLINDKVAGNLNLLNQRFFNGNRILDRIMTSLVVTFIMPKTEATFHIPLAHKYPLFADELGSYMEGRNQIVAYLETMTDVTEYNSPLEMWQKYLDYQIELEDLVQECINIAIEEADITTKVFLEKLLLEIQVYTNQALLLVDKSTMYGNNEFAWMMFDEHCESFLIPELRG